MATSLTTNYGMWRVREMSPDAKDWAATDGNIEVVSKLLKALENHTHTGSGVAFPYPGYNTGDPSSPTYATLTEQTSGGILTPGTTVGVRLAFQDSLGLETDASPETSLSLAIAVGRPDPPTLNTTTTATPGLSGGTYVYVVTKKKGSGETLASDILPVTLGYDTTRSVTVAFDAINTYTDGTTALNIYRANGLNAAFQLVATITSTSATTYVDTGTTLTNDQPPASSTFDASRKVRIDWTGVTVPTGPVKLRVYVTQQRGIWGNNCLLAEYDVPGQPDFVDYLGSESLAAGSPLSASQLMAHPAKIDLSTQTTGAPTLTANMNFAGFQALNLRLHNNSGAPSSPTNGYIYYDTSTNNVRAYINGAWVTWGTTTATAYTHPSLESGGHDSANIKYRSTGANVTVTSILDRIADNTTGAAKQVQTYSVTDGSSSDPTTSNGSANTSFFVPEMSLTSPTLVFSGQLVRVTFDGQFKIPVAGGILNLMLEINGTSFSTTMRSVTAPVNNYLFPMSINYVRAIGSAVVVKVLWWTSTTNVVAVGTQRSLYAQLVF